MVQIVWRRGGPPGIKSFNLGIKVLDSELLFLNGYSESQREFPSKKICSRVKLSVPNQETLLPDKLTIYGTNIGVSGSALFTWEWA